MNTAFQNPIFSNVNEPRATYQHGQSRSKQITRIISHLRDQLRHTYPQLAMPSQWMIRQLIENAMLEQADTVDAGKQDSAHQTELPDWRQQIIDLLLIIRDACDVGLDKVCTFVHTERLTPLFPNHELFDEWDVYRFSAALLHFLEKDFAIEQDPTKQ
jgi:hypothetical protein